MKVNAYYLKKNKEKTRINLNPYIIWRYEPYIFNGTLFIYNKKTKKIYTGDNLAYLVFKEVAGEPLTVAELIERVRAIDGSLDEDDVVDFLEDLIKKEVIEVEKCRK